CRLAFALGQVGRPGDALQHYEEALRLEPELQEAHQQVAALLLALGRAPEALEHALRAAAIAPNSAGELVVLGQAFRANRRLDDALAAYREAARLEPGAPEAAAGFAETVRSKTDASPELRREAAGLLDQALALPGPRDAALEERLRDMRAELPREGGG